jgi:hypothetical protein
MKGDIKRSFQRNWLYWLLGSLLTAYAAVSFYAHVHPAHSYIVQTKYDGTCVKILDMTQDGKKTILPCEAIAVTSGRYDPEPVYGTDAETQAFARDVAAHLPKNTVRQ